MVHPCRSPAKNPAAANLIWRSVMQFRRIPRAAPRPITSRKVAAYRRSCQAAQDRLPLFAVAIAETQLDPDAEMARRAANV